MTTGSLHHELTSHFDEEEIRTGERDDSMADPVCGVPSFLA